MSIAALLCDDDEYWYDILSYVQAASSKQASKRWVEGGLVRSGQVRLAGWLAGWLVWLGRSGQVRSRGVEESIGTKNK